MRNQSLPLLFVSVIILSAAFAFPAHATVYSPGVKVGDYVTLGHITYTANGTSPVSSLNGTSSLTNTVTGVMGKTVTAQQYWTFNNGTSPRTNTVQGDVETGIGNLTLFIIAGGLTAGDPINQLSQAQGIFTVINQTVTRTYAGATRSVNVQNYTQTFLQYFTKAAIYNDAATGFLLEFSEFGHVPNGPTSSVTFSFDAVATSTNVWLPSSGADFSFDATPVSSTEIIPGASVVFHLNLTSFMGFNGPVAIVAGLVAANSTITNHVTISPASSAVTVPLSKFVTETLTASSTSSTPLGLYILSVNATGGGLSHSDRLAVRIVSPTPPDFTITANPTTLQIPQGTSSHSIITVTSQGGLSGTVSILAYSTDPTNLVVSPTTTTLTLTANGQASFDLTITAANNAPAIQYQVVVTAILGTSYHSANIYPTVTSATVGDFSISANPSSLTIPQGHARYTNTTVTSLNGFAGSIAITYDDHVPGALDKGPVGVTLPSGGTDTFPVEIYVPTSTLPGNYYLNVTGTASSHHTLKIPVQVTGSSSQPGFNITITPASQSITQGSTGMATVTLRSLNGFHGTVTLWSLFSSLPSSFSPSTLTVLSGQTAVSIMTIAPSASVTPGVYRVDVEGVTNSTSAYDATYTAITVTPGAQPDFSLTPTSTGITVVANSIANDNLRVDALNGFTGTVSFIPVASPFGGVSYYCSPVILDSAHTSGSSVCVFSSSTPGTYSAVVNGTGGNPSVSHKVTYAVTVIKASPTISTTLSASTITAGDSVTDSATLTGTDIFTASGTVTYQYFVGSTCTGTPTVVGSPVTVTYGVIPMSQSWTFSTAGSFSWNAVYSGDAANNGATSPCESLTVNSPMDYSLTATPTTGSITAGSTFTATITATLTKGVGVPVTLSISNSPNPSICLPVSGVSPCGTFSLSPTTITPTSTGASSTLTVVTTATIPPGTYTLTITGQPSGTSSASATITLTVTAPTPTPDFTISATTPVSFTSGTTATSTVNVAATNGFYAYVTLTTSAPNGLTVALSSNYVYPGTFTATFSSSTPGSYTVTITGTSGTLVHSATVQVTVTAVGTPDFTINSNPSTLTIQAGNSGASTITITPSHNFAGTVALTATIPPGGLTASLSTYSISGGSGTSTLTVNIPSSVSAGTYTITVKGASGSLAHSTQVTITVTSAPSTQPAATAPTILGLSPLVFYGLIGILIAAVIGGVVVIIRRKNP